MATNRNGEHRENKRLDLASAMYGATLVLTGDHLAAARTFARTKRWSVQMVELHPALKQLLEEREKLLAGVTAAAPGPSAPAPPQNWKDLHGDALAAIAQVLRSEGAKDSDKLAAALAVVERNEGKVPSRVEVDDLDAGGVLGIILYRWAANMMLAGLATFEDAIRQGEADPSIPEAWGREVGLLKPGQKEIAPASGP
jgi:hypothetical protein